MARVEVILDVKFYKAERDIKIKNINNGISPGNHPQKKLYARLDNCNTHSL